MRVGIIPNVRISDLRRGEVPRPLSDLLSNHPMGWEAQPLREIFMTYPSSIYETVEHFPKFDNTAPVSVGVHPIRQQDRCEFSF